MTTQTKEQISDRILDIIADKNEMPREKIAMNALLTTDLGFDSLDAVELIMEVEKEWNLALPDEETEKLTTVQSLVDFAWKQYQQVPEGQKK